MYILKHKFSSSEAAKEYYNKNAYNLLDVTLALYDLGLHTQMLHFSWHFAEPDVDEFYNWFAFDFEFVKDMLGIPKEYVSRDTYPAKDMDLKTLKRNPSELKYNKQKVEKVFAKLVETLQTETKEQTNTLKQELKQLLSSGKIKKEDIVKKEEIGRASCRERV